jgi:uncharacterized protein YaiE (UPF0345 family)
MEVMSGETEVLLPDKQEWQTKSGGDSFEVPANSTFSIRVLTPTDYCCSFIK